MQFIVLQRKIIVEMSNSLSIVVISSTSDVHSDISDFDHSLRYFKHSKQMFVICRVKIIENNYFICLLTKPFLDYHGNVAEYFLWSMVSCFLATIYSSSF